MSAQEGPSGWAHAQTQTVGSVDLSVTRETDDTLSPGERIRQQLNHTGNAPPRVGRFFIQREIGAGGMGAVFAGLDPELDRRVAVKLVQHDAASPRARLRLRREAQALAQLSHPNVVPVFEVGEHEGHTFVAMELVVGSHLADWLDETPRPWKTILEVFAQAGEGLAAAHEAGLVHRDFKPHNVLVGADGRVRVVDFGLATDDSEPSTTVEWEDDSSGVTASLTRTGELLGTPAYMAPEQFAGHPVGPACDQFAFCVALFQALTSERPFDGKTVTSLASNVLRLPPKPLPPGPYPAALEPLLARGLARRSDERHRDMRRLLDALGRIINDRPKPRSKLTLALGVATAGLAGALALSVIDGDPAPAATDAVREAAVADPSPPDPSQPDPSRTEINQPEPIVPDWRAPDGEPPNFERLSPARAASTSKVYEDACRQYSAGKVRAAARLFARAAIDYQSAGGGAVGAGRIQYARALAHRATFDRDGRPNDLRVAHELLFRLQGSPEAVSDPSVGKSIQAWTALRQHPELAGAGLSGEPVPRFAITFVDKDEPGAEVSVDGVVVGHEPCSAAVPFDGGGHTLVVRHERFYDSFSMWNPRSPLDNFVLRAPLRLLPAGATRESSRLPPMPPEMPMPPVELSRAEDWPD